MNLATKIAEHVLLKYAVWDGAGNSASIAAVAAMVAAAIAEHEKATPAIEPEYRILEVGEVLQEGDEAVSSDGEPPFLTHLAGETVKASVNGHYRRKTTPIQPLLDNPHVSGALGSAPMPPPDSQP